MRSDVQQTIDGLSPLQADAWVVWNKSYHVDEPEPYRALGRTLYRQDVHERIMKLFTRLDEQNEHLDRVEAILS